MRRLFYLSAGSGRWGTGHLRRSVELINALQGKGLNVDAVALVPDNDEMQKLSSFVSTYNRCVQSLNEIGEVDADRIVVDVHTDFQPALFPWIENQKHSVVALDWYYDTGKNIITRANLRGGADALKYAIIRKEFQDAYKKHSGLNSGPEYDAVVMMGGGDIRKHLDRILNTFAKDRGFSDKNIVIILGPMVDGKLDRLPGQSVGTITILRTPDNIADVMANASVGITNGGTSLMEFTMLGVPTIIFPQSREEENFVRPFLESRCSVLGSSEQEKFKEQITGLWKDKRLRKTMSENARQLIDGNGTERIAEIILNTFFYKGG